MDWQLGILSGFAFAIFYSVPGLPIAHFSEGAGRKRVAARTLDKDVVKGSADP
jgi:hypothetical protein